MSTGTFFVDSAALQSTITQNCGGSVYTLGAAYDGGYVIYLGTGTVGNRLGLVVAPTDTGTETNWTNTAVNIGPGDQYQGIFTTGTSPSNEAGNINTTTIINATSCTNDKAECAAYQATQYSVPGATSGWFLPSQAELMLIWAMDPVLHAIDPGYTPLTIANGYWSSTEFNNGTGLSAWYLDYGDDNALGAVAFVSKIRGLDPDFIRTIRAFTY